MCLDSSDFFRIPQLQSGGGMEIKLSTYLVAFAKMTTCQEFLIMLQPLGIEIICIFFFTGKSDDHCQKKSKETLHILELK